MEIVKDCHLDIIRKDTRTFCNDPTRIKKRTQMASNIVKEKS